VAHPQSVTKVGGAPVRSGLRVLWLIAVVSTCAPACSREQREQNGRSPPPVADAAQPPSQSPRAFSCSTPAGVRWLVSADSVGPIPLEGLTIEVLRSACPQARDSFDANAARSPVLLLARWGGGVQFFGLSPVRDGIPRGEVGSVLVTTPEIRTRQGLGVGSTLEAVRRELGPQLIVFGDEVGAEAARRSNPANGVLFVLEGFEAVVRQGGGWQGDTLARSDAVPGSTRVTAVVAFRPSRP